MKVNSAELLKTLNVVCKVIPSKPIVPLQEYITIENAEGIGSIRAFSDTLQISVAMNCSDGDILATVHNSAFLAYVQKLPQDIEVELTKEEGVLNLRWNKGKSSFPLCEEDVPMFRNEGEEVLKMSLKNLRTSIAQLRSFCATDELRPSMTCVCIDPDTTKENGIKLVAFSNYGGAIIEDNAKMANPKRVLIHPTAFTPIMGMSGEDGEEVTILAGENHVFVATEGVILQIRAVEQQYPPYERVIPTGLNKHLDIAKNEILSAMRRCTACSNDQKILKLDLGNVNVMSAQNLEHSTSAEEVIEAKDYEGEPFTIGINANLVSSSLQIFGDDVVRMSFVEQVRPLLITSENDPVKVIMTPVKL